VELSSRSGRQAFTKFLSVASGTSKGLNDALLVCDAGVRMSVGCSVRRCIRQRRINSMDG
jgi:hypothetical protein